MKVQYFPETDTLYIEFRDRDIVQSKDLDENTVLDLDAEGNVCAITFEHASDRTDVHRLTVDGIAGVQTQVMLDTALAEPGSPVLISNGLRGG